MKKRDLEKKLRELGWYPTYDGSKHDKWTNGVHSLPVPRHREIREGTARAIIKEAIEYNEKKGSKT